MSTNPPPPSDDTGGTSLRRPARTPLLHRLAKRLEGRRPDYRGGPVDAMAWAAVAIIAASAWALLTYGRRLL